MNFYQKIFIKRTKSEWRIINEKISASNKDDLGHLLRTEISNLVKKYNECPECYPKGKRTEKRPQIYHYQISELEMIAQQMELPVSTVVDRLIIEPLLNSRR